MTSAGRHGWIFMRRAVAAACPWIKRTIILLAALAGLGAASPPLGQRAYVWQRSWAPALTRDLPRHCAAFGALDVLAAEITLAPSGPTVVCPDVGWRTLASVHLPVGVVVRIGPWPPAQRGARATAQWIERSRETRCVLTACRTALDRAERNGVAVAELQIDFDAATAHLREYAQLLGMLRREFPARRIVFTALPTWLRSPDWPHLADAADAYVLQVHSLEKPRSRDVAVSIFDPNRARAWIHEATRLGRPFRVALPAYGYRVGFADDGRFLGLEAEGDARAWPDGTTLTTVMADPTALAAFVRELCAAPPPNCEAISWFRFPVSTDELAWRWSTLATVMTGRSPAAHFALTATSSKTGVVELVLTNDGTADGAMPPLRLSWTGARLVAADSVGGVVCRRIGDHALMLSAASAAEAPRLGPGDSLRVGWLRLDQPAVVATSPL